MVDNKQYVIGINDYELDENGIVLSRDGGDLIFNDADDFIMMWNYFKSGPLKDITDDGKYLIMRPKEFVGPYVTDYQITGDAYKVWKEYETEIKEILAKYENNNKDLPF